MFDDLQGLLDSIYFWFKPDAWSFFDGSFMDDFWAELKLSMFLGICGGIVYLEWILLSSAFAPAA